MYKGFGGYATFAVKKRCILRKYAANKFSTNVKYRLHKSTLNIH